MNLSKQIIVIEGTDGSGKQTQSELLKNKLIKEFENCYLMSFPNYTNICCEPVKHYLNGEFGSLDETTPYAASTLFAVDRLSTWKMDLKHLEKKNDYILLLDRYTTSNMLYQASKIKNKIEAMKMVDWISDLEYNKMKIPKPTMVIFLDMPPYASKELRNGRKNKFTNKDELDIHESNEEYLESVYAVSKDIAYREGWIIINCTDDIGNIKTIGEIHKEIYNTVLKTIERNKIIC